MKKISIIIFVLIISITSGCDDILNTIRDDINTGQQVVLADSTIPDGAKQDGRTWETAFNNIQVAVDYAQAKGIPAVWAAGEFIHSGASNIELLVLKEGVTIYGGFTGYNNGNGKHESDLSQRNILITVNDDEMSPQFGEIIFANTILNGNNNAYHILQGSDNSGLDGVAVTGGTADPLQYYPGGGMIIDATSPIIRNCTFSNNKAFTGGCIKITFATPLFERCLFFNNKALSDESGVTSYGGAISIIESSPIFRNCTFSNNSATVTGTSADAYGGAIYNENSYPEFTNCDFINNFASYNGGGMYNIQSNPVIIGGIFENNNANTSGGGMYNDSSNPYIIGCDFIANGNNNTTPNGGAIYILSGSNLILNNCILKDNRATTSGGGIYINSNCSATINRCTIDGNIATNSYGGGVFIILNNPGVYITNSIIVNNISESGTGGGVSILSSSTNPVYIINCTIVDNLNDSVTNLLSTFTELYIFNTIEYGNTGNTISDDSGYTVQNCLIQSTSANISLYNYSTDSFDPSFENYSEGNYRLSSGSPCIDAANYDEYNALTFPSSVNKNIDRAGKNRFYNDPDEANDGVGEIQYLDMGAYEYQP